MDKKDLYATLSTIIAGQLHNRGDTQENLHDILNELAETSDLVIADWAENLNIPEADTSPASDQAA